MIKMNKKNIIIFMSCVLAVCAMLLLVFLLSNRGKEEQITHEIIFDSNGGSEISKQNVIRGKVAVRPENPEKAGYFFAGWKNNERLFDFNTIIEKDTILVADWIEVKQDTEMVIITFETDGGTTIYNQIIEKGLKVKQPEKPIKNGYVFEGWYYNEMKFDFNTEVNENIILIAKWKKDNKTENKSTSTVNNNNSNNIEQNSYTNTNVEKQNYKTPVLVNAYEGRVPNYVGKENGKYIYDLGIKNISEYLYNNYEDCIVDGYDVFEKIGTEYRYISTGEIGGAVVVEVEAGAKKVFVARTYIYNSKNQKIYSDNSNEVIIDNIQ